MNGIDFLVDTNVPIYVLEGHPAVKGIMQCSVAVSVFTEMELLGRKGLLPEADSRIRALLQDCEVLAFTDAIKNTTIALKQQYILKLPDAIIAATAKQYDMLLITADKDFKKLEKYIDVIILDI